MMILAGVSVGIAIGTGGNDPEDHGSTSPTTPSGSTSPGGMTTQMPFTGSAPPDRRIRIIMTLSGFTCGLFSLKKVEICLNMEQGVCICMEGRRRAGQILISVIVGDEEPLEVCRGKKIYVQI